MAVEPCPEDGHLKRKRGPQSKPLAGEKVKEQQEPLIEEEDLGNLEPASLIGTSTEMWP